ncbi:phage portal protein [Streptomyces alfalfae]|uniref:phage portal protein n=1 Tax=Streptomyces alfalfae TaxID=1642299 RepID=UPI001BAB03F1|nr:phage portal protein [Streptomyces alfalfae]QUI30676.1 phage portal protein [Streptomyces alfalfae]
MAAVQVIGSVPTNPREWLDYLHSKLLQNRSTVKRYSAYYDGEHQKLAFSQARHLNEFGHVFEKWRDNFCGLIIDSVNERMAIDGFRMTDEPAADADAREIWQRNHMDAESNAGHLDAMVQGSAYAVVWADQDNQPTITLESAENVVVQYKPGSRRELEAAAKFYTDDWGRNWATVWFSNRVWTFAAGTFGWANPSQARSVKNPLGEVPVVPLNNRARLTGDPISDLSTVIPLQDAVNKIVSDALLASEYAAWPQRYVTGLEIVEDDNGNPVEPFKIAVDKLLQAEDPNAKFGQFEAADLGNYVKLADMLVQHMASTSRIPFHYFLNGGVVPSGESITAAEAGLIAKTRERMLHFGEAWEKVMRLCFKVLKDKRAEAYGAEVIWRDPENRTESQHIDALLKLKMVGVPTDQLLSDAGYTPQQIERFRVMREEDARIEMELAKKYPMPTQQPEQVDAQKAAQKQPQGNAGNQARKNT